MLLLAIAEGNKSLNLDRLVQPESDQESSKDDVDRRI
jgi:hypothetical protein